jgi:hypothetical protein
MKKSEEPDYLLEYDFSGGVRGKYLEAYREGTNVVLLDPDVAARFPTSEAVNRALRAIPLGQEGLTDTPSVESDDHADRTPD